MNILRQPAANDNNKRTKRETFERLVLAITHAIEERTEDDEEFGAFESVALAATNEAVRRCLTNKLQRMAESFADRVVIRGRVYKRHQSGSARYFGLCGAMEITRWTYRRVDVRNGPTVVPLDLAAGVSKGATPALAFAVAQGVAKAPVRSVEQDLKAAHRTPPSRTTMDRLARHLGTLVNESVDRIEPLLRAKEKLPAGAMAINLGLDRTTIPMEEADSDEDETAVSKRVVRYRMAYVGTVCVTNERCETLVARRYAAPAHEGAARMVQRMKADLEWALSQNSKLNVGVVQDGASEMWNLMREMLRSIPRLRGKRWRHIDPRKRGDRWRETIDRYHLMEKLARCLELLVPGNVARREAIYERWDHSLNKSERAICVIRKWIEERQWKATRRVGREIHRILGNYFLVPKNFFYATLPALGLQQGSGVTEGACKSLITMRAKRSGQRWRPVGISALLAIRCLMQSERFDLFWPKFQSRFRARVEQAA
jgi:hypothetical protein